MTLGCEYDMNESVRGCGFTALVCWLLIRGRLFIKYFEQDCFVRRSAQGILEI